MVRVWVDLDNLDLDNLSSVERSHKLSTVVSLGLTKQTYDSRKSSRRSVAWLDLRQS